jgi:type III secretion protein U
MSEKNQKPTAKHLREARKRGEVPRSAEVTRAFVLVACLIWLGFGTAMVFSHLSALFRTALSDPNLLAMPSPQAALMLLQPHFAALFLPPLVIVIGFSVLGDFLQIRGLFTLFPLMPQMDRLNPASGFKNLFSMRTLVHLGFSLLMVGLILACAVYLIRSGLHDMSALITGPVWQTVQTSGALLLKLVGFAALIHVLVACADFAYQQYDYQQRQRMSIEEVRREFKDNEGDPYMKSRRRAIAREDG